MELHGKTLKQLVQCAVLCASCDLPAGRKLCEFLSFNASYGCSKCWKKFTGMVRNKDYSGFNRDERGQKTNEQYRQQWQG